ncbi:MAG: translation initiation factor IF-2 associated domain-containing protein, partial [Magnetococcus sp. YQC-9]
MEKVLLSDLNDNDGDGEGTRLTLKAPRRIVLRKTVEGGSIKQNFSHGRSKSVVVEVRKKRTFVKGSGEEGETLDAIREDASEVREKSRAGVGASSVPPPDPGKDRKHQILTPMTPAERQSFQEQQERERLAREQVERERLAQEQAERERLEAQRLEAERREREDAERRRLEAERLEAEQRLARQAEAATEAKPQPQQPQPESVPEARLVVKPAADKGRLTEARPSGVAASVRIEPAREQPKASP